MTNSNVLTQYQSEVIEALKSAANLGKPFEKVIIDTLKLFMAIPDKINFLQMGRYGEFTEQTYRNTFTRDDFDWFAFNLFLANKVCTGKFRAIAVDPSFIPKAGNKTPWFGIAKGSMSSIVRPATFKAPVRAVSEEEPAL